MSTATSAPAPYARWAEWVEYLNSDGDSTVVKRRWCQRSQGQLGRENTGASATRTGAAAATCCREYYANEYRRYQTYCRDYGSHKLYKIACGPGTPDTEWTEVVMKMAHDKMDALTMHYYTVPHRRLAGQGAARPNSTRPCTIRPCKPRCGWTESSRATSPSWTKYDPEHRVGLIVDEWGTWHNVEPDTNPGFLYQQNTMRDALVASLTLDIFNKHSSRVVMANLAQTVNVLQAVILTEGDQMVLTPTYHVFDLYKAHQDAGAGRPRREARAPPARAAPRCPPSA